MIVPIFSGNPEWFPLTVINDGFCGNDWWDETKSSLLQPHDELAPDLVDFEILAGFWDSEVREALDDGFVEVVWWGLEFWFVFGEAFEVSAEVPGV